MPRTGKPREPRRRRPSNSKLTQLGRGPTRPSRKIETFPNEYPHRDTVVTFHCTEFTCLCPITGQPDFATLEISYIPDADILESKSLKLFLWTYRKIGIFHESLVNELLETLAKKIRPRWMRVSGQFHIRGGIGITVTAETPSNDPR